MGCCSPVATASHLQWHCVEPSYGQLLQLILDMHFLLLSLIGLKLFYWNATLHLKISAMLLSLEFLFTVLRYTYHLTHICIINMLFCLFPLETRYLFITNQLIWRVQVEWENHPQINLSTWFTYRFMKHNLKHLSYISDELDSGNVCPACPQVCTYMYWPETCKNDATEYIFRVEGK